MTAAGTPFDFRAQLDFHRESLKRFVEREARGLLAHESADDLVQGVHLRALRAAEQYVHRGEREFLGFLATLARRHIADRHEHWSAMRRSAGSILRVTLSPPSQAGAGGANPAAQSAGPATFAERREQVGLAMKALDQLPERDRKLMEWHAADVPLEEIALRLGIAYDAAKHARQRALEKFRDAARRFGIAGA